LNRSRPGCGRAGLRVLVVVLLGLAYPLPLALAAPKTDVVVLRNGDRITGEIKDLASGQLNYKTDDMGTIEIEWDKILRLTTKQLLRVETRDGAVLVGSVPEESEDRVLRLVAGGGGGGGTVDVPMDDVVGCKPLDTGSFFSRLDGSFTVGYDFTRSTGVENFNASFELRSKARAREWSLSAFTSFSDSDSNEASKRNNVTGSTRWIFPGNQYLETFAQFDSNTALALNFRALGGGAYGAYLVRNHVASLTAGGGLSYAYERFSDSVAQDSVSAVLGLAVDVFVLDTPKKSISGYIYAFPGLTDWGRFRADANLQARIEIVKDLFFQLGFWGNYDNQARQEGGESYDYGVTTSLGYTF
jgi:hypothetical protein